MGQGAMSKRTIYIYVKTSLMALSVTKTLEYVTSRHGTFTRKQGALTLFSIVYRSKLILARHFNRYPRENPYFF